MKGLLVVIVLVLVVIAVIAISNRRNKPGTQAAGPKPPVVDDESGDRPYNNGTRK